jgi:hypothetical protein
MRLENNRGVALIMVLGIMTFLTAMQLQMVVRGIWQARAGARTYDRSNALYLAESALKQASVNLRTSETPDDINADALTTGSFEVGLPVLVEANLYKVVGRGISAQEQRELEATIQLTPKSIFQFALFGDEGVRVTGSTITDGYDSSQGPYNDEEGPDYNKTRNGDIGTNSSVLQGVYMGGSVFVDGQVAVGYDADDPYSVVSGYDPNFITGGTDPPSDYQDVVSQTESFPMPEVIVPGGLTCSDSVVSSNDTVVLEPNGGPLGNGTYCYRNLTLQGGGTLTASGNVNIYITGVLTAQGNSMMGVPDDPGQFLVQVAWTGDASLEPGLLTGTTGFYGALYAPESTIDITGNAEIFGSIIAKRVNVTGSAAVHYDESLSDLTDITNKFDTEQISWREL